MANFLEALSAKQPLLFDGGIGSMLTTQGLNSGDKDSNLLFPIEVQQIQRDYVAAGCDCLTTNSFPLNAIYCAKHNRLDTMNDALKASIENALTAADGKAFVIGDIGPGGDLLKPFGLGDPNAYYEAFCEQAEFFTKYQVDAILLETVFQWGEMELMIKACKEAAPNLPIISSMTFTTAENGGRTLMGDKASDFATKAAELGVAAIGGNCGDLTILQWAQIIGEFSVAGLPVLVQPNAGLPQMDAKTKEVTYNLSPADFAKDMLECYKAGATILGGCCGTTPKHLEALAKVLGR